LHFCSGSSSFQTLLLLNTLYILRDVPMVSKDDRLVNLYFVLLTLRRENYFNKGNERILDRGYSISISMYAETLFVF